MLTCKSNPKPYAMYKIDLLFGPFLKTISSAVAVLVLFCVELSIAQPNRIHFDHITTQEGLSQNDVNCIVQDQKGFMWFGTNDGLNRFDGYEFLVYKPDPNEQFSIGSNLIQSLAEDSSGRIWIGTAGKGLNCFDQNTQKFYHFQHDPDDIESLGSDHVIDLMVDRERRLWVGTVGGLNLFEIKISELDGSVRLENLTHQLIPKALQTGRVDEVYQDEGGDIWTGSQFGLFRLKRFGKKDGYKATAVPLTTPTSLVRSITKDQHNNMVICAAQGIMYQTGIDNQNLPVFSEVETGYFQNVVVDHENRIWAASNQGLYRFEKQKGHGVPMLVGTYANELNDIHSLNKDVLRTLYMDRNGMIWAGLNGGGVNKFDPEKMAFRHFKKNLQTGSIGYDKIRSIFEDSDGNIWMGSEGGGLDFLAAQQNDGNYNQFQHMGSPKYVFALEEIQVGPEKLLYFGGQQSPGFHSIKIPDGTTKIDANSMRTYPQISGAVFALLNDQERYLWVGTYNQGIYAIDRSSLNAEFKFKRARHDPQNPKSLSSDIVRSLLKDKYGNIWVGTGDGLNMISAESIEKGELEFTRYRYRSDDIQSLSHNYVLALYESEAGDIWVGTFGGGLNKFVPETGNRPAHFIRYTEKNRLANDVVKGILEDENGYLWIATNKGLSRFDPRTESFKNYDTHDGLQSDEFSELACYKRRNGEMLFGGVNGFNAFLPGSFQDNSYLPEVVFTEFQVLNKPISAGEKLNGHLILKQPIFNTDHIDLRYNENSFSFEFAALHFTAPGKNQYQYKLEGFNENWITVSSQKRFATYTNLSPGDYTLFVKASNNDGLWNHQPSSISIHISPPFWLTWWAYLLYALVIIGLLAAFRRYTIIGIKEKHDLVLEHIEIEKAEELHQMKLQFFTNISHELRTPLTLISGPLEHLIKAGKGLEFSQREQQYHLIKKNANFLLRLVNQLLDFRKLDQGKMNLQVQKSNVVNFVHEITEPFQFVASKKQIDYEIISPEEGINLWFDPDILEKMLYNLLSNAFKFTQEGGEVLVAFEARYSGNKKKRKRKKGFLDIRIKDNGPGIPAEKKEQIFERFFRAAPSEKSNKQGSGIGLAFTKSLIELHHGEIRVESEEGQGTCFILSLPLGKKSYSKQEIAKTPSTVFAQNFDPFSYLSETMDAEEGKELDEIGTRTTDLPSLLIVDDHKDIRTYLRTSLDNHYQILEAADGAEGLEMVIKHMPDLVISDMMMPVMDGIEFCNKLKTDPKISHIPVIILTAKSSEESELEGLSTGVDAYVRKPFNMDILKTMIQNILAQRQELKDRFRKEIILEPEEITVTSADEMFLKKAMEIVEDHMGDPDFSVESMVKEIGMSRSKLYLKLKALTDQSTSEFIRTVRLKRAVQLLEKSDMTVKEIMYMTGFNTASYFSKCFKKQFGVAPSEYLKKVPLGPVQPLQAKN